LDYLFDRRTIWRRGYGGRGMARARLLLRRWKLDQLTGTLWDSHLTPPAGSMPVYDLSSMNTLLGLGVAKRANPGTPMPGFSGNRIQIGSKEYRKSNYPKPAWRRFHHWTGYLSSKSLCNVNIFRGLSGVRKRVFLFLDFGPAEIFCWVAVVILP
jgi:hypothetical protein